MLARAASSSAVTGWPNSLTLPASARAAQQAFQQGRLTRAITPEQANYFTGFNIPINALQYLLLAKCFVQIIYFNDRWFHLVSPRIFSNSANTVSLSNSNCRASAAALQNRP
jgi:hypothetical protein